MRLLISILSLGLTFAMSAEAATAAVSKHASKKTRPVAKAKAGKGSVTSALKKTDIKKSEDLQTDVKFDDSVLHGQYQTPEEALAKVENEKGLGDLVGVRKHFKDRLQTASEQE